MASLFLEKPLKSQLTHLQTRCIHAIIILMKYPWKTKRFYPVLWPAQAISKEQGRVVLPMGRGRASLILPLALPEHSGAVSLGWNHGFELHVCVEVPQAAQAPGAHRATVDLGEIHLAAVSTNTGKALIVTGRGIRSHRDLVGAANMYTLAYGSQAKFPRSFTYLRPGLTRRRSRADTPQRCLSESAAQPLLVEQVSSETGHPADAAQKPVSL